MLRNIFDKKLLHLQDQVLVLGGYVEEAVAAAVRVVVERDSETALDLISNHRNLRRKCRSIEAEILVLLATQQPVASDLRTLASTLEVALELERIGDHAKEIAGIGLKLELGGAVNSIGDITRMAQLARAMLRGALEAYATGNETLASTVPGQDDEVDELYNCIHQNVLSSLSTAQNSVGQAIYLSQVGHHLERVADRTTNICEWVMFSVTGDLKELSV